MCFNYGGKSDIIQAVNKLVREVVKAMRYQVEANQVEITYGQLPECVGDHKRINQVLSNLIDNAMKYLDLGRKGKIRVWGKVRDGMSVYCVEDNGIGISERDKKKVFEIFHRLDLTAL